MAATHWGNCQICGREHKVSGQSIAKHGYTIRNGWQEGACYGSGGKPIQISCDLIEGGINSAKSYIERTNKTIDKLAANPLDEEGQITIMVRHETRNGSLIYPTSVKVSLNDKGEPVAIGTDGKKVKTWPSYTGIHTVEQAAWELATKQIAYLSATVEQAQESIDYMTERLKNWKPSELREISASDRSAEAPKVHFEVAAWGRKSTTICASSTMGARRMAIAAKTTDREKVTCAACLKALKERDELPAKRAAAKAKEREQAIKSLEKDVKMYTKWIKDEEKGGNDAGNVLRFTELLARATADLEKLKAEQQ